MGKLSLAKLCVVAAVASLCIVAPAAAETDPAPGTCDWQARVLDKSLGLSTVTGSNGRGSFSGTTSAGQVATLLDDGVVRVHPLPAGYDRATAEDQNWSDTIAGTASDASGYGERAFTLQDDTYRFLPLPDGYFSSRATAINNRGDVAGVVLNGGGDTFAAIWLSGQAPVVVDPDMWSTVADIDDDGSVLVNGNRGARVWKDGVLTRLSAPAGLESQEGRGIKAGKIVGHAGYRFSSSPFIWDTPTDPPRAITGGWRVWSINRAGLIAGQAGGHPGGPPAVWFASNPSSHEVLPVPPGYDPLEVNHVSDDGQLVANTMGTVVVWKCHLKA